MTWDAHPANQAWRSTPGWMQEAGLTAGQELLAELERYAVGTGRPLTEWDRWTLQHSPLDLLASVERYAETHSEAEAEAYGERQHAGFVDTHRRCIFLVREWVEAMKRGGATNVVARPGLRLPEWIKDRYEAIYSSNLPWHLSAVMQSAFMGAPQLGERKPWKSK